MASELTLTKTQVLLDEAKKRITEYLSLHGIRSAIIDQLPDRKNTWRMTCSKYGNEKKFFINVNKPHEMLEATVIGSIFLEWYKST
jgi:hypothetical protein